MAGRIAAWRSPRSSWRCCSPAPPARTSTRWSPRPRSRAARPEQLEALREQHALALRIHEQMERQRSREAELSALYETARDLTAIRDLDAILAAIVRRARQLLQRRHDLPLAQRRGRGRVVHEGDRRRPHAGVPRAAAAARHRPARAGGAVGGAVLHRGLPGRRALRAPRLHRHRGRRRADPRHPRRPAHRRGQGHRRAAGGAPHGPAVPGRRGRAADLVRRARRGRAGERPALRAGRAAVAAADEANAELRARNEATERAAHAHDLLTDVLLHGGGVVEVADVLARGARRPPRGVRRRGPPARRGGGPRRGPERRDRRGPGPPGRCVQAGDGPGSPSRPRARSTSARWSLRTDEPMDLPERRTLERGALVTALVLLFGRSEAEAESRVRGELLADLSSGRDLDADPAARAGPPAGRRPRRRAGDRRGRARRRSQPARARVAAGAGPRAARPRRRARGPGRRARAPSEPLRARRAAARHVSTAATVGVAACRGRRRRGSGSAWREARQSAGRAAPARARRARSATPPGSGWPGCCSAATGPQELEEFIDPTLGPVLDLRPRAGHPAGRDPRGLVRHRRRRCGRPPTGCTSTRTRSPSGSSGSASCSGSGWREPGRKLDVQLALQMVRLAQGQCELST